MLKSQRATYNNTTGTSNTALENKLKKYQNKSVTALSSGTPATAKNPYAWLGQEIIPVTGEESTLGKIGKNIVNYGLGTVNRTVSSVQDLMKQLAYNIGRSSAGLKSDYSKNLSMADVFGDKYKSWLEKQNPIVQGVVSSAAEGLLDPTTYVAGGLIDDLARAGRTSLGTFGKSGMLGTTENLKINSALNQKILAQQAKKLGSQVAKTAAKETDFYVSPYGTAASKLSEADQKLLSAMPQPQAQPLKMLSAGEHLQLPEAATGKIELGAVPSAPIKTVKRAQNVIPLDATYPIKNIDNPLMLKAAEGAESGVKRIGKYIPMDQRTIEDVASKEVKAFQFTNPEVRPAIKSEAENILNELKSGVKGERFITPDEYGDLHFGGTRRMQSESIDRIQNLTGASYNETEDALKRIIDDKGRENTSLAKKVELVIDDNLTYGVKRFEGFEEEPNIDYIRTKSEIDYMAENGISAANKIDTPFQATKGEVAALKRSGLKPKITKLSDVVKDKAKKAAALDEYFKQGEYRGIGQGQKYEFPFSAQAVKNIDAANVPQHFRREMVSAVNPAEMERLGISKTPSYNVPEQFKVEKINAVTPAEINKINRASGVIDTGNIRKANSGMPPIRPAKETVTSELGKIERGFSRNVRTDLSMADELRNTFTEYPLLYEQMHNPETLSKATAQMANGYQEALQNWYKRINDFDAADVPLAHMLANEAVKNGDIKTARTIITDVAEKLTQAGQFSQAARILRKSDPSVFMAYMERQIKKLNEQGLNFYKKKWSNITLTDDEIKAIHASDILGDAEREDLMMQIGQRIAETMPSKGMEKFDAWRRIAMLLNPKTHIRNTVGNAIMLTMRKSADTINAGLQKVFLKEGDRTAALGWRKDNALSDLVNNTWEAEKKNLQMNSKWDISNLKALGRDKQIFKGNTLNALDKFTKDTLALEDNIFLKGAYQDALGGYLKANNLNAVTDAAKQYAKRRAYEATFKEAYWLTQQINKAKKMPIIGKLVEGAIPFTSTPVNIAARAFEYSPAGLIKSLATANKNTGARVIEDLSKGLTGTAAVAAGMLLKKWGFARGAYGTSKIAEGLQSEAGEQPNSIITPWGSYTFDWAQPAAIPLAMGISIAEAIEKKDPSALNTILDSVIAGGDTLFNTTMLKNIKDLFGGQGSTTKKLLDIPVAYIEQAIPTILGQVARSIDPIKRSTYSASPLQAELKRIQSKIPFASKLLEPAVDVFGNEQKQNGFIQQFISPGYAEGKSQDKVTNELLRLYKSNKETDYLPKILSGKFTQNGVEYVLSPAELTSLQKELGNTIHSQMSLLMNNSDYDMRSEESKISALRTIVNNAYNNIKKRYVSQSK